jgi:hypothetical protein
MCPAPEVDVSAIHNVSDINITQRMGAGYGLMNHSGALLGVALDHDTEAITTAVQGAGGV